MDIDKKKLCGYLNLSKKKCGNQDEIIATEGHSRLTPQLNPLHNADHSSSQPVARV